MKTIKFSHDYPKLWGQKKAMLIDVNALPEDYWMDMPDNLVEYDTILYLNVV